MQVSVETTTRRVRQWGKALGGLDGCVIEEITPDVLAAIHAASPDHGGGVILSEDHQTITPTEPSIEQVAEQMALAVQRAADAQLAAAVAAHPDPVVQELARRLGITTPVPIPADAREGAGDWSAYPSSKPAGSLTNAPPEYT